MPDATVVLVEGESDRIALRVAAAQTGRDLDAEAITVVAMGGITNVRAHAVRLGPTGDGVRLAGLYDAAEESFVCRGLVAAGIADATDPAALPRLGFFRCNVDLEDELIRALGIDRVEQVIHDAGEARALARLAAMPAQRDWSRLQVLRRFFGSQSGRKARYAALLVADLGADDIPGPLAELLDWLS